MPERTAIVEFLIRRARITSNFIEIESTAEIAGGVSAVRLQLWREVPQCVQMIAGLARLFKGRGRVDAADLKGAAIRIACTVERGVMGRAFALAPRGLDFVEAGPNMCAAAIALFFRVMPRRDRGRPPVVLHAEVAAR